VLLLRHSCANVFGIPARSGIGPIGQLEISKKGLGRRRADPQPAQCVHPRLICTGRQSACRVANEGTGGTNPSP
jgi:hypothetical protein